MLKNNNTFIFQVAPSWKTILTCYKVPNHLNKCIGTSHTGPRASIVSPTHCRWCEVDSQWCVTIDERLRVLNP